MKRELLAILLMMGAMLPAGAQDVQRGSRHNNDCCTRQKDYSIGNNDCYTERNGCAPADSLFQKDISPSTLIIYFSDNNKRIIKAAKKIGAEVIYTYRIINAVAISKPKDWTLEQTKAYFEKIDGVLQVNYDHIYHLD